jgi:hypothetical protein
MGNSGQGTPVLPGQVQGVKKGAGIAIANDGTISVDASTVTGLVKLNNNTGYNGYVWPNADGASGTFLKTDGIGNLSWSTSQGLPVVTVGPLAPAPTDVGELWYDTGNGVLKIYQTTVAPPGWTATSQTPGLGLAISGSAVKLSVPIQFGPPVAGTLPAQAIDGSLYWDDNLGLLFIRYNDGTSTQWVQVTPSGGGGGSGTVTSVGLASAGAASGIAVSGAVSPITSSGTYNLAIDVANLPLLP